MLLFVRGKIDPKIGIEVDVSFVFQFVHDHHDHVQCALHQVARGLVNPVQSNVKC